MTLQIVLSDMQIDELRLVSTHDKLPIDQLVMQAVEDFLVRRRVASRDALGSGLGLWGEGEDGVAYQQRLRDEW